MLAIAIGCLGLFGLASFMAEQRTKEIGIVKFWGPPFRTSFWIYRKISPSGWSWPNLVAWPAAFFIMSRWLENFAYRVGLGWQVFFLGAGLALLIALLTVSSQSIRAALRNPVDSLRYE